MIYGYARVSAAGQDYAEQVAELQAAGCDKIHAEQKSAAHGRRRPEFEKLVSSLRAGDVLIVTRLNRFARSTLDALHTLAAISAAGASFRSLREGWADTTTPAGRLLTTIMTGFAEYDREEILARTAEGRQAAKARGVKLGRRPNLTARQTAYVRQERDMNRQSIGELAALLGVSKSTITRAARRPAGGHAPNCPALTSGAGINPRCTCGGQVYGSSPVQMDIEEVASRPSWPPSEG